MRERSTPGAIRVWPPLSLILLAAAGLFFAPALACMAPNFVSSEDHSRFDEYSYKKAEPGMRSPGDYIAFAERAIGSKYKDVFLTKDFHTPVVTRRFYRNAPKEDQNIICVSYVYSRPISGGGQIGPGGIFMKPNAPVPILQALIRKDGSKVYVNVIEYRME